MAFYYPGKFIYLAQPHTASSSMTMVFRQRKRLGMPGQEIRPHHIRLRALTEQMWNQPELPDVTTELPWTVLRNPYDLFVSMWFRRRSITRKDFRVFCLDWKDPPYVEDGMLYYHAPDAKRILRYESLEDDLSELCADVGIDPIELPTTNVTGAKDDWHSYYTQEHLDIVNRRWGAEFAPYYTPVERVSDL